MESQAADAEAVRTHLSRILASAPFVHSERIARFLRFTVEEALQGRGDRLKEYRIGVEVFDRDPSYDPRIDPIVRVEARRLRDKLKQYYETEGRNESVRIEYRKGTYAPAFHHRAAAASADCGAIAVLPFINRSADPENEYFSDGLTDELTHALTKIEGLRVVAPASAFQFKGTAADLSEIGERLQVGAVLEGSVRRSGNRVRITAQLVNVADGCFLWSETYDREIRDIFAIQEEIARAIVDTLRIRLTGVRPSPPAKRYRENIEAYNLYLKGRYYCNRRTGTGLKTSIEYFEKALALDPQFAPAWAGLADAYSLLGDYGIVPPREIVGKAKEAAMRALEIDDDLAEAEASLAFVICIYEWKWAEAGVHFRRALQLNPGYAEARHWYGYDYLAALGLLDEALAEVQRAQQLDPLSLIIGCSLGSVYLMRREYDHAIEQYQKVLAMDPTFYKGYTGMGRAYIQQGLHERAVECFEKGRELSGGAMYTLGGLGQSYAAAGRTTKARELLNQLLDLRKRQHVQALSIALIYIGLTEYDAAFEWLERAYEGREAPLGFIKTYPAYDAIRSDPRFASLVERVGLAH